MTSIAIVGTQWGDEGKGKITDYYAKRSDYIVRFQGGNNAGHTIKFQDKEFKLHLVPSGLFRVEKIAVIGNGVLVDPGVLLDEIDTLEEKGIETSNLMISDRANLIMPYHKKEDELNEKLKGELKAGTTKRGIGPCYSDKVSRYGIRIADLYNPRALRKKLENVVQRKNKIFQAFGEKKRWDIDSIYEEYLEYGKRLERYVEDVSIVLNEALEDGKKILFEGAQGTHLDIDHGIYPYTTSSNTVAGGASIGTGIGPLNISSVLGIVKAYTSRVGTGPFPTELEGDTAEYIREKGGEYGTTTGRPRRVGWLDLVMLKSSARINSLSGLAVTNIDVLSGLDQIKVCTGYRYKGEHVRHFPGDIESLYDHEPVFKTFEGWKEQDWDAIAEKGFESIPENAKKYLDFIENETGVPIEHVSIGPERHQTVDI